MASRHRRPRERDISDCVRDARQHGAPRQHKQRYARSPQGETGRLNLPVCVRVVFVTRCEA